MHYLNEMFSHVFMAWLRVQNNCGNRCYELCTVACKDAERKRSHKFVEGTPGLNSAWYAAFDFMGTGHFA